MDEVQFGTLHPDGKLTDVRVIKRSAILACPHVIMAPSHFRSDGTCRCNDPEHIEMAEWGYKWSREEWFWV